MGSAKTTEKLELVSAELKSLVLVREACLNLIINY